jgi:hypothetical protein
MEAVSSSKDDKMDEKAVKLLQAIANRTKGSAAALIRGSNAEVNLYVGRLKALGLIHYAVAYPDSGYHATQAGLEYLHKKGLL